jgi:tetratricopeptide (TPR) repeat protein
MKKLYQYTGKFVLLLAFSCGPWEGFRLGEIDQQIAEGEISITQGIEALEEYLVDNPDSGAAYAMLASIYLDLNQFGKVEEYFQQALDLGASEFQIDVLTAKIAYLREEWAKAAEHYESAILMEPGDGLLYYRAAQSWYSSGNHEKAYENSVQAFTILGESPAAAALTLRIGIELKLPVAVLEPWLQRSEGSPHFGEVTALWNMYTAQNTENSDLKS